MTPDTIEPQQVRAALADFPDPETGAGVVETGQLTRVEASAQAIRVTLGLSTHSAILRDETRAALEQRLREKFPAVSEITVEIGGFDRPPAKIGQIGITAKSVIAVASGKGGVGKSTIAAAIALGLARSGSNVGLMDADVYGPSIPHLLGVNRRPEVHEGRIQPIEVAGLKVISMGFLVPPGEAVVWRGPMLHGAITQFLRDTAWGELDYLVIDMPPGTGDIALTLSQLLPLTGAVVVCTPQEVALLDAVKAVAMFRKVNIPILGMVENMSSFVCGHCGTRSDIFGHGGAQRRAAELDIPFLGDVPIDMRLREAGDAGRTPQAFDDAQAVRPWITICENLVRGLEKKSPGAGPLPVLSI